MQTNNNKQKQIQKIVLSILFTIAIFMGPGPGIYLINPDASDPNATFTIGNVPILYLWAILWFVIEATIVLAAYFLLWETKTNNNGGNDA